METVNGHNELPVEQWTQTLQVSIVHVLSVDKEKRSLSFDDGDIHKTIKEPIESSSCLMDNIVRDVS